MIKSCYVVTKKLYSICSHFRLVKFQIFPKNPKNPKKKQIPKVQKNPKYSKKSQKSKNIPKKSRGPRLNKYKLFWFDDLCFRENSTPSSSSF